MINLQLNRHTKQHIYRAALEGIAFSFVYGMEILTEMGVELGRIRVGNDNLFQSTTFSQTISTLTNARIDVVETNGAVGAARGSGFGVGHFPDLAEAFNGLRVIETYHPGDKSEYQLAYDVWKADLMKILTN